MSTVIKPTVGRVVWFQPGPADADMPHQSDQPLAAIIARVAAEGRVNLTVLDANGNTHSRTGVRLVQEGEEIEAGERFCAWMPYQRGQAAKNDKDFAALKQVVDALTSRVDALELREAAQNTRDPAHKERLMQEPVSELDKQEEAASSPSSQAAGGTPTEGAAAS